MTVPLASTYKPVDPMVFALNWFKPLGATDAIGAKRWAAGMVMPYRWPKVIDNRRIGYVTHLSLSMNTLAATFTEAAREANRTDDRAQVLVDYTGWVPNLVRAKIVSAAHEEPYAADSVATRFVSEYLFVFALVAQ